MKPIPIRPEIPPPATDLYIGKGLLESDLVNELSLGYRKVIIADEALKALYAENLAKKLGAELICIPSGEAAKTRAVKERIEDLLLSKGYGRDTLLISLGGGATSDFVGFLASTYLRGVPLILIPTTLLAMVDAAIGGKTAIDTAFGKNLIGSFYHPQAILADLNTLQSLPPHRDSQWSCRDH